MADCAFLPELFLPLKKGDKKVKNAKKNCL